MELYNITLTEAMNATVDEYAHARGISKAEARKLFVNALIYNVVADEIVRQMDFLKETKE